LLSFVLLLASSAQASRSQMWREGSWEHEYSLLHEKILQGEVEERDRKFLVWTCGRKFRNDDCVGYANRLLGLASAFLASVLSSRALIILWHGEESLQLHNFFRSSLIDWRFTEDVKRVIGDPRSIPWTELDFTTRHVSEWDHSSRVVLVTMEKADFRDLWRSNREEILQLGINDQEEIMGRTLPLLLQPTGKMLEQVNRFHHLAGGCFVVGLQIRVAREARRLLPAVLSPTMSRRARTWTKKVMLSLDDLDRFYAAALHAEQVALEQGEMCVKWSVITDDVSVLNAMFASSYTSRLIHLPGPIGHLSKTDDVQAHMKVMLDHFVFALSNFVIISAPSSFGLTARAMNLTGRTDFYAIHSKMYYELPPSLASRPETSSYSCGIDQCFCGYWGFSGHMCTPAEELCDDCIVIELPMCRCEVLRVPFSLVNFNVSISKNPSTTQPERVSVDLDFFDLPADFFLSCNFYHLRLMLNDVEYQQNMCDVCHAQHDCKFVLNVLNMNAMDDYQANLLVIITKEPEGVVVFERQGHLHSL